MNHWLAQLVLAVRNGNEENGWVQILVFMVMAIIYVIGSIAKARANKDAPKISRKPVRKPPESVIDLQMLRQIWRPEKPVVESQATRPQVQPTHRKVARPTPQAAKPQVQPKIEKVPELIVTMPQVETAVPVETSQVKYLSDILSDFENPESLRRAILHYEILGKPISLRGPLERFF